MSVRREIKPWKDIQLPIKYSVSIKNYIVNTASKGVGETLCGVLYVILAIHA